MTRRQPDLSDPLAYNDWWAARLRHRAEFELMQVVWRWSDGAELDPDPPPTTVELMEQRHLLNGRPPIVFATGRPRKGLAGSPLRDQLAALTPRWDITFYSAAIKAGRHRSLEQREAVRLLACFIALPRIAREPKRNTAALASMLECSEDTIRRLKEKGMAELENLFAAAAADRDQELRRYIGDVLEQQTERILAAIGLRPPRAAEVQRNVHSDGKVLLREKWSI